ncbi:hypothetical protein HV336_22815 [Citrobacter freundii]|uniref:hypothetical protein n=1 Tax=Citrobacter freundii TaxID=546 RepID=UPI0015EA7CCD|nr:hypothetical protein [Citrobacter freundii]QLR79525.1 hypothetical protein HV336_22815 [Citrobacter freundii]
MNDNWIYVGADVGNPQWSKIGKTTIGLHTRHTSSQNPGYFIYTAYNIISGDVHKIEEELLNYIESLDDVVRQNHISTGSKSECFFVNPFVMSCLVESFIENDYPSSVYYDNLSNGLMRYQCDNQLYRLFDPYPASSLDISDWFDKPKKTLPDNLKLSKRKYFSGNKVEHEVDLGHGYFLDLATGMQGYRDENGNIEWDEWK